MIRNSGYVFGGFTLIELLLYMSLLAVFLTVLTQIFTASIDTQLESESESSVQQDGKFFLARLQYDIERASTILDPSYSGSSSASLQFVASGVTNTYTLTGSDVTFTDASGTYNVNSIGTKVSNLQFLRRSVVNGKPIITLSFILTSVATRNSGPNAQTFQTTVGTR